jgi:predicted metal-dependent hydrolase
LSQLFLPFPETSELQYRVRESRRAKRIILRVTVARGLEVVVPSAAARRHIPEVLAKNRTWIERTLRKLYDERRSASETIRTPPTTILLPAIEETWQVTHLPIDGAKTRLRQLSGGNLHLSGDLHTNDWQVLMQRWLITRAQSTLGLWLNRVSQQTDLRYARLTIRLQKTRWGSCSAKGYISLNARLLFLTPELTEYVLLHELCHLRELNHSRRFWRLVERFEPNWRRLDRALIAAAGKLPRWTLRDGD